MDTSLVTTKCQIVIPSKLRHKFHIKRGTKICFIEKNGDIVLRPLTDLYVDSLKGSMQTTGAAIKKIRETDQGNK